MVGRHEQCGRPLAALGDLQVVQRRVPAHNIYYFIISNSDYFSLHYAQQVILLREILRYFSTVFFIYLMISYRLFFFPFLISTNVRRPLILPPFSEILGKNVPQTASNARHITMPTACSFFHWGSNYRLQFSNLSTHL